MKRTITIFFGLVFIIGMATPQAMAQNKKKQKTINRDTTAVAVNPVADSLNTIRIQAVSGNAAAQNQVGAWYYYGLNEVAQNYDTAAIWWARSAKQGDAEGIGYLALCCQYGHGMKADSTKATQLFIKSFQKGNSKMFAQQEALSDSGVLFSAMLMGYCYQKGVGCTKSTEKSVTHYMHAADKGQTDAQVIVGQYYMNQQQADKAFPYFVKAAELKNVVATYYCGKLLFDGKGVDRDADKAVVYLLKAAEEGHVAACLEMGNAYYQGSGVEKNLATAFDWYKKAALSDNRSANWNVAMCYQNGMGIQSDFQEALYWFACAAQVGYINKIQALLNGKEKGWENHPFVTYMHAQKLILIDSNYIQASLLGKSLEKSKRPEGKLIQAVCMLAQGGGDAKKAVKMLQSIKDTNAAATFELAKCYERGTGIGKDLNKAVEMLQQLADADYMPAINYLGDIYYEGRDIDKNLTKAVSCYLRAEKEKRLTTASAKRLAECYRDGMGGLKKDSEQADKIEKQYGSNPVEQLLKKIKL